MARSRATISSESIINNEASALVRRWLASSWLVRKQDPDVFVDWDLELVEGGEPSGKRLFVQQKGKRKPKVRHGHVHQALPKKHLRYFSKITVPAFLLIVDLSAEAGYYLHIQEWIEKSTTKSQLTGRGTLTLKVPVSQRFDAIPQLTASFEAARAYMARLHPGTVEDAIAGDLKRVELPEGWGAKLDVIDGRKHYNFFPTKPGQLTIKMGEADARKLQDAHAFGTPVTLDGKELAIEGIPDIPATKGSGTPQIQIRSAARHRAEFHFWVDGEPDFRITLPGEVTVGAEGARIHCWLEDGPLSVEVRMHKGLIAQRSGAATAHFSWTFSRWKNKPANALPYFSTLERLCDLIMSGKTVRHQLNVNGDRLTTGHFGEAPHREPFVHSQWVISQIRKFAKIAPRVGFPLLLPDIDALGHGELKAVDWIAAVLDGQEYLLGGNSISIEAELTPLGEDRRAAVEALTGNGKQSADVIFPVPENQITLFGKPIKLPPLEYHFSPARVIIDEKSKSDFISGKSDTVQIHAEPESTAQLRIRQIKPSLPA